MWLGVLAVIVVVVILDALLVGLEWLLGGQLSPSVAGSLVLGALVSTFAAGVGGYVARKGFIGPIVVLFGLGYVISLRMVHSIALGQTRYAELIHENMGWTLLNLALTILGAWLGMVIFRTRNATADLET
jgi:hypothetical protein